MMASYVLLSSVGAVSVSEHQAHGGAALLGAPHLEPQRGVIYQQPSYYFTNTLQLDEAVAARDFRTLATAGIDNVGIRVSVGDLIPAFNFATGVATYNESACAKLGRLAGLAEASGMRLIFNTHLAEHVPVGTPNATWTAPFNDTNGVLHRGTWRASPDLVVRPECRSFILAFHEKFAACVAPHGKGGVLYWKHAFESMYVFPSPAAAASAAVRAQFARWASDNNSDIAHWASRWHEPSLASFSDVVPPASEAHGAPGQREKLSDYWRFWLLGVLKDGRYGVSVGELHAALTRGAQSVPVSQRFSPLLGFKHWKPKNFFDNTDLSLGELRSAFDLPINVTAMGYYVNDPATLAGEPAGLNEYIANVKKVAPPDLPILVWETGSSTLNMTEEEQRSWATIMMGAVKGAGLLGFNWWQWIDWSPKVGAPDKQIDHFGSHFANGTAKSVWGVLSTP